MIRVLVFSRVRLYREGLAQILGGLGSLTIVGTPSDDLELSVALKERAPDVLLLDMAGDEGCATASCVRTLAPTVAIVAMGIGNSHAEALTCVEFGAVGFVTREASVDELVAAVHHAARGDLVCSPRMTGTFIRRLSTLASERAADAIDAALTRREREIATLLQQNRSNKEIAVQLGIEVATVKNHVHNVLDKLKIRRRSEAASAMRRHARLRQPA